MRKEKNLVSIRKDRVDDPIRSGELEEAKSKARQGYLSCKKLGKNQYHILPPQEK